jgi:hypothetical protein
MGYLWWKHRGHLPLDPAADAIAYKAALLTRGDGQIDLLRSVTNWSLLPLLQPASTRYAPFGRMSNRYLWTSGAESLLIVAGGGSP